MSEASRSRANEALADVRRWLCDHLSEEDAGRVCGMLSDVSWHVNAAWIENARLRDCLSDDAENARQILGEFRELRSVTEDAMRVVCYHCHERLCEDMDLHPNVACKFDHRLRKLGIEVERYV